MPHLAQYVALAARAEEHLAQSFESVAAAERVDPDTWAGCRACQSLSEQSSRSLVACQPREPSAFDASDDALPPGFWTEPLTEARTGALGLVRDLQDLLALVAFAGSTWTVLDQAAKALQDDEFERCCADALVRNHRQAAWCTTRLKAAAPQALLAAR